MEEKTTREVTHNELAFVGTFGIAANLLVIAAAVLMVVLLIGCQTTVTPRDDGSTSYSAQVDQSQVASLYLLYMEYREKMQAAEERENEREAEAYRLRMQVLGSFLETVGIVFDAENNEGAKENE